MENCAYLRKNPGYAPVINHSAVCLWWNPNVEFITDGSIKANVMILLHYGCTWGY